MKVKTKALKQLIKLCTKDGRADNVAYYEYGYVYATNYTDAIICIAANKWENDSEVAYTIAPSVIKTLINDEVELLPGGVLVDGERSIQLNKTRKMLNVLDRNGLVGNHLNGRSYDGYFDIDVESLALMQKIIRVYDKHAVPHLYKQTWDGVVYTHDTEVKMTAVFVKRIRGV